MCKSKTHYDPYCYKGTSGPEGSGEYYDPGEKSICGVFFSGIDDTRLASDWNDVTCKRCLKQKGNINKIIAENEKAIIDEYGKMAEAMKNF